MTLTIDIAGAPYPASLNMEVYAEFEMQTGRSIAEIKENIGDFTHLVYLAIRDGCDQKGVELEMTLKDFRRRLQPSDFRAIADFINKSMNAGGEVKKKKQKGAN